jgi:hypothetical protein
VTTYAELIQFDPIETVIQLRDASELTKAKSLVGSYVFSDEMAERIKVTVIPQLRFDRPADNKALMIVGNYGTGKSHLMSVLSAVAEHGDLLQEIRHPLVQAEAKPLAGKFKVVRTELGATKMPLRDFICQELEHALAAWGLKFAFPAQDKLRNHKGAFEQLMGLFVAKFPDQGLLFIVDELLDYLKTRQDQQLVMDLNFLREIGEICKDSRFRFIAGAQEAVFDTDRFKFVADNLRRVKDRFEQLVIVRNDVSHVVAERLLRKTDEQRARIREYLTPFAKAYGDMNERLDDYVRLFPIHPGFIKIMQEISVVEKRIVLRTFSDAMKGLLKQSLPSDRPGLIAYDHYWKVLNDTPEYKAIPDVAEVIKVAGKLQDRVEHALSRKAYRPMAHRIVAGLAVHRLTQRDLEVPLGATPEEIRDGLCLYDQLAVEMGGDVAENLATHVVTVLKEVLRTVDGQFITCNPSNQQYFLDLKKSVDYETLIAKRAETVGSAELDRGYFTALKGVMLDDPNQTPHVPGYHIWARDLTWLDRNVSRLGYLFFGSPNDRSTAVPERDFYFYFLPAFDETNFKDEKRPDEVFIRLKDSDEALRTSLKMWAAAVAMESSASGAAKAIYTQKADVYRKQAVAWLNQHLLTAARVTHEGRGNPTILECAKGKARSGDDLRHVLQTTASVLLEENFGATAPEYPRFSQLISTSDRPRSAAEALRVLGGATRTKTAIAVLDALELLDGERIDARHSRYAARVVELLKGKGPGQVLNRNEILTQASSEVEFFEPGKFRLEPEWVAVVLAALVYNGDAVLAIPGDKFDAANLAKLAATDLDSLLGFKHLEAPKDWNVPGLRALFELLDAPPGHAQLLTQGNVEVVQDLHKRVQTTITRLANVHAALTTWLPFWGQPLLPPADLTSAQGAVKTTKEFLESLQNLNTPGKFKNFRQPATEVSAFQAGLKAASVVEDLRTLIAEVGPLASWLSQAAAALPTSLPSSKAWTDKFAAVQQDVLTKARDAAHRADPSFRTTTASRLTELKKSYVQLYRELHGRSRLGHAEDKRKNQLLQDQRFKNLERLTVLPSVPAQDLTELKHQLASLRSCWQLTETELEASPVCPHCQFRPADAGQLDGPAQVQQVDGKLDRLWDLWSKQVVAELGDPTVEQSRKLLPPAQQQLLSECVQAGRLPDPITPALLDAIREALSGLIQVKVTVSDLRKALTQGDSPARQDELVKRLDAYLTERTKGVEREKIRIVLE